MNKSELHLEIRILICTIATAALFITLVVDYFFFGSMLENEVLYKKDCSYIVPEGWGIETNGKVFVIRHTEKGNFAGGVYLCAGRFEVEEYHAEISKPLMFSNECKAKNCLRKYLDKTCWNGNFK